MQSQNLTDEIDILILSVRFFNSGNFRCVMPKVRSEMPIENSDTTHVERYLLIPVRTLEIGHVSNTIQ